MLSDVVGRASDGEEGDSEHYVKRPAQGRLGRELDQVPGEDDQGDDHEQGQHGPEREPVSRSSPACPRRTVCSVNSIGLIAPPRLSGSTSVAQRSRPDRRATPASADGTRP